MSNLAIISTPKILRDGPTIYVQLLIQSGPVRTEALCGVYVDPANDRPPSVAALRSVAFRHMVDPLCEPGITFGKLIELLYEAAVDCALGSGPGRGVWPRARSRSRPPCRHSLPSPHFSTA